MRKVIDVAFCVDDAFAIHLAVLIYSIGLFIDDDHSVKCHIIGDVSSENKENLNRLSSPVVSMSFYSDIPSYTHIPISNVYKGRLNAVTYYRFSIPNILYFIDRVIFIDVDMIALDDVSSLWNVDLDGNIVGVVSDHVIGDDAIKQNKLGIKSGKYFNAGLMLMDLVKWRSNHISEKALNLLMENKGFEHNDQDALNIVLENNSFYLDLRWNAQPEHLRAGRVQVPALVHFCGQEKPWHVSSAHPYTMQYLSYREKTPYKDTPLECYLDDDDHELINRLLVALPSGGRVVVWGAGQRGRRVCYYLKYIMNDYELAYIIDKNAQGSYLGVDILNKIVDDEKIDALIIASIAYRDEIIREINAVAINKMNII